MLKRSFDIVFASSALLVLSPVLLAIAGLVKLTSKGPVLHRSLRTGRFGRAFHMLKFRTMVVNADKMGGLSTAKNDPRITRIGRLLRRSKLDELPQLLNVVCGQMSIVGPRPEFPYYTDQYCGDEKLILSMRPGLTDYASLRFRHLDEWLGSEQPDRVYEEQVKPVKNALRVQYVKDHNFKGDLVLIFQTLKQIVAG